MDFPPVQIKETSLPVEIIMTNNRNAYAKVRKGSLLISIPSSMRPESARRIAEGLYNRMKKNIVRRPEAYLYESSSDEIHFNDNDVLSIMDRRFTFRISYAQRKNVRGTVRGDEINIIVPDSLTRSENMVSRIARRILTNELRDKIEMRVNEINQQYFRSKIENVKIINASTRWGSCTTSRRFKGARISLNFKLLLMPKESLDYVIVHELAHTKLHNHSKAFWNIVGNIIPDYKQQKRMLKQNAYQLKISNLNAAQAAASFN